MTYRAGSGICLLLAVMAGNADFKNLDYVNPDAPKGGRVKLHAIGSFDTFNRFTIKGDPAAGLGFVFETLMTSPDDEISAEYGLIAESIEVNCVQSIRITDAFRFPVASRIEAAASSASRAPSLSSQRSTTSAPRSAKARAASYPRPEWPPPITQRRP